jgi:hypothetical protein
MGLPLQQNAPQFTLNGKTVAIGAFLEVAPFGNLYMYGVFVKQPDGSWNSSTATNPISYTNSGDLFKDVTSKGGIVAFTTWLKSQINIMLSKEPFPTTNPQPLPPTNSVVDDATAQLAIVSAVNGWIINNVNGVPIIG